MSPSDTTFVLTSCGRFDLLAETMLSFLEHNTAPIARYVVVEDSGDPAVRDVLGGLPIAVDFIVNDPPLRQMGSIDRAYTEVATPYVFHCEDDWRFFRGGFVEASRTVIDARPDVSVVIARRAGQNPGHDALAASAAVEHVDGVAVRIPALAADPVWGSYTFNPGLRRLDDWRRAGSFAALGDEAVASRWFKARGMRCAYLEEAAYETTGRHRHVNRDRPETLLELRFRK